jgi:oligosaccharyltransferase complex subunit epsilon
MSSSVASASASGSAQVIASHFLDAYTKSTSKTIQLIDYFLAFAVLSGVIQFAYMLLVGTFPFNSFLAGFLTCVGFFVFTVCLRLQVSNPHEFHGITRERAYADYVVCNIVLFFVVFTFIG